MILLCVQRGLGSELTSPFGHEADGGLLSNKSILTPQLLDLFADEFRLGIVGMQLHKFLQLAKREFGFLLPMVDVG
jgi:hypothetical protein